MAINEFTGGADPSVSRDQWLLFAVRKLAGGYVLVRSTSGKAFNFRKPGQPMQPCDAKVAQKLMKADVLEEVKQDGLGTHFGLKVHGEDEQENVRQVMHQLAGSSTPTQIQRPRRSK